MREIDFMPVGESHGDAICIRYGDPDIRISVNVIDGGYTEVGEEVVKHITNVYRTDTVDNVLLTHADNDHARGLITIMENLKVGALHMNRPWRYAAETIHHHHGRYTVDGLIKYVKSTHEYLVRLEEIATDKGIPIHDVVQGSRFGAFTVLAPSRARYVDLVPKLDKTPEVYSETAASPSIFGRLKDRLINVAEDWNIETLSDDPVPTSFSNETSAVVLFSYANFAALFTGDVGPKGLMDAYNWTFNNGLYEPITLFQIPHQGSRRNLTKQALNSWLGMPLDTNTIRRGSSFCTVGKGKTDLPRKVVINALIRRGYTPFIGRGQGVSMFSDIGRQGFNSMAAEPFQAFVEDYS